MVEEEEEEGKKKGGSGNKIGNGLGWNGGMGRIAERGEMREITREKDGGGGVEEKGELGKER